MSVDRSEGTLLPQPKAGIVEAVFKNIAFDRDNFIRRASGYFLLENPELADLVAMGSMTSLNPDVSVNWAVGYYELFSHSTRQDKSPMMRVSNDLIIAYYDKSITDRSMAAGELELRLKYFQEEKEQREERIGLERESSDELDSFWMVVNNMKSRDRALLRDPEELESSILRPLYTVNLFLRLQDEINRFRKQFSIS